MSAEFESLLGAFQGDCLSGCLFTMLLAAALNHLRAVISVIVPRPVVPIAEIGYPQETEYADDLNMYDEDERILMTILGVSKDVFLEWNLFINEEKTEFTRIFLDKKPKPKKKGKVVPTVKDEEWRKSVVLGSLLCSSKDVLRRCTLGNVAFNKYEKLWLRGHQIPLKKRILLYEAQVVSVMLYNSSSWAVTASDLKKLDVTHRHHLRTIIGIKWPNGVISNINLYQRCNTRPLSERVAQSRWNLFGHILRSPENTPAQVALLFAAENGIKGRVGRHQLNLYDVLRDDVKHRDSALRKALKKTGNTEDVEAITMKNIDDVMRLREVARDRSVWRKCYSEL